MGSSIYYALGLVAALALGMTPIVFVIAGIIFILTAASYTEATAMYPEAGGSASFARQAFDETVSFGAAWAQAMNFIVTAAISALFIPHYLAFAWEPLRESPADIVAGVIIVFALAALNIRGVKESARLNVVMAVTDLATQLALAVAGIFLVLNFETLIDNIELGTAPEWRELLIAIPIAMIAYTGIETVSNMSEEAIDAPRTVPKAMRKVVLAVVIIYAALPAIALSALPVEKDPAGNYTTLLGDSYEEGGYASDPVLGVVDSMGLGPLEGAAEAYVGVLAATILLLAANAGIFGVSRLIYSMGQYQQLPGVVSRLHPRFRTPYVGIAGSALLAAALVFGPATFLGNLYASFAMLSFTIAHLSVIVLRRRRPHVVRPYTGPGNLRMPGGWTLPLFAVAGAFGTGIAFIVVTSLHPLVAAIGAGWLAFGGVLYAGFRRRNGLPLRETRKLVTPARVAEDEVVYHSTLIVCDPAEDPGESLGVARRLADSPRHVRFLSLIPVPGDVPFEHPLESESEASKRNTRLARRILGPRAEIREMRCRRNRKADTIIREALLARSEAIVMPMPPVQRRISRDNLFGGTRLRLLEERPCRILLVEPATVRASFDPQSAGDWTELEAPTSLPSPEAAPTGLLAGMRDVEPSGPLMVCVFGSGLDDDVMQTACRLASPARGELAVVHAVAICDVPHETPVAEVAEEERRRMAGALRRAEAIGEEYEGVDVIPHLYAAHHVGLTTVLLSRRLGVEAILIGADDAAAEERDADAVTLVGRVTQTVMRYAACRVVLTAAAHKESIKP